MKGIILALFGFLVVSSAHAGDAGFGLTSDSSVTRNVTALLQLRPKAADPLTLLIPYDRTEVRGGKPTIAYTVFRFTSRTTEFSLQPVLGSINGAQVQLTF